MTLGRRRAPAVVVAGIAALAVSGMAAASPGAQRAPARPCALSARQQLPAGSSAYALTVSARRTSCTVAIGVMRAFQRCRGDQHTRCATKLGGWSCAGHKRPGVSLGLPIVFYGSFTCRSGARRVAGGYEENSPACFGAAARDPRRPCLDRSKTVTPDLGQSEKHDLDLGSAGCDVGLVPGACVFGADAQHAKRHFALIGDSHTFHWRAALALVAQIERWRGYTVSAGGCWYSAVTTAFTQDCAGYYADVQHFLSVHPEIDTVFTTSNADTPVGIPPGETYESFKIGGFRDAWAALPRTVRHIVVLRDTTNSSQATFDCMARAEAEHQRVGTTCALARSIAIRPDMAVETVKALHAPRYQSIDLTHFLCGSRACYPVIGGARVNADIFGHLTPTFMRSLGPYLLREVRRLEAGW